MARKPHSRAPVDPSLYSQVPVSLTAGITYVVIVIVVTLLLSFPGIGVALLPQPFLDVVVLGKTVSYDFASARAALWVLYVLAVHVALYLLTARLTRARRPYVPVSVLLYLVNLALVFGGLADEDMVRLANTYTIGYAGIVPGIGVTLLAEWLGYRLGRRLWREPTPGS